MDLTRRMIKYGPGGPNCPCCGIAKSFKRENERIIKHAEKQMARKDIQSLAYDIEEHDLEDLPNEEFDYA